MMTQTAQPKTFLPAGEDFLLLPPTAQAYAYRNVDRMFATRTIRRGDRISSLPRGAEIAPTYVIDGVTYGVDDYLARANVAGLLVIRDGQIVLERYALGLDERARWSSMSTIKSLTATLVGVAIKDGAIKSLDDAVSHYIPELRGSAYDAVRVRDVLTMSSGVEWNEDYTDRNSHVNRYSKSLGDKKPGGVLALMKELRARHPAGTVYNYNSGDTYVLGCLLTAATGERLADYMSRKIWQPFGMEQDAFYTLEAEDGQEIGGSRAGIVLRDFGRFGLFLLGRGRIDGTHIVPEQWVEQAGRSSFTFAPDSNRYGAVGYGYSFWIDPDGAMVAVGFAGQSLYINRDKKLAIVTLSCQPQPPYDQGFTVELRREYHTFKKAVVAAHR